MIFERNLLQTLARYRRTYIDIIGVLAGRRVVHQSGESRPGLRASRFPWIVFRSAKRFWNRFAFDSRFARSQWRFALSTLNSKRLCVRIIDRRAPRAKTLHAFNATVNSDSTAVKTYRFPNKQNTLQFRPKMPIKYWSKRKIPILREIVLIWF